jgi:hypothetical protein
MCQQEDVMATPKNLYIQGIEVTQAIQYYRSDMHLADPKDQGKDNALTLVANKTAWVRVYVRSRAGAAIQNVTGTLRVERTGPDTLLANLTPQPPGSVTAYVEPEAVTGIPSFTPYTFYRWERSSLAMTLNFIIPANQMCGYLRLTARVTAPDGQTHEMITFADATLHQTIHFRAIMIGYNGKDPANPANTLKVDSPSLADLQHTAELTLRMYPLSEATYEVLEHRNIDFPLESSGCGAGGVGWAKLMNLLDQLVAIYGEHPGFLYYGLIAPGVPGGGGCNSGKAAAGYVESPLQPGANRVMVHEIGHFFTGHAPCGLPSGDSNDSNYPEYEPYGSASVGEYGLDINSGDIMPPEDYKDIMSYCPPEVWVSIYSHKLRIYSPLFNPTKVCRPQIGKVDIYYPPKIPIDVTFPYVRAQPRPVIHVFGIQDILGNISIKNVFRALSYGHAHGSRTSLIAVLQDANGQMLASAAMVRRSARATEDSGCGCCDDDSAGEVLLSDVARRRGGQRIAGSPGWQRDMAKSCPRDTTTRDRSFGTNLEQRSFACALARRGCRANIPCRVLGALVRGCRCNMEHSRHCDYRYAGGLRTGSSSQRRHSGSGRRP